MKIPLRLLLSGSPSLNAAYHVAHTRLFFFYRIFFLRAKSPEKRRDSEKRESLSWHYKDHFTQSEEVLQKSLAEEHVYGILKPHGYQLQVSIRELFSAIKASKAP